MLCVYPGEVWKEADIDEACRRIHQDEDMGMAEKMEEVLSLNYTYAREDGVLINATPCERLHKVVRKNPFALGYLINHSAAPNAFAVDMSIRRSWKEEELDYVPTWKPLERALPVDDSGILTVFVAMRDLCNEEILIDYDFGDDNKANLPDWYEPVPAAYYLLEGDVEDEQADEEFLRELTAAAAADDDDDGELLDVVDLDADENGVNDTEESESNDDDGKK